MVQVFDTTTTHTHTQLRQRHREKGVVSWAYNSITLKVSSRSILKDTVLIPNLGMFACFLF